VEGCSRAGYADNVLNYSVQITKHFGSWNAADFHAVGGKPYVAGYVVLRPITPIVHFTVNLDRKPALRAEKVEHVRASRMLAAELVSAGPCPQCLPEQHLRQAHLSPQRASLALRRFRPVQHVAITPPPPLRGGPPPLAGEDPPYAASFRVRRKLKNSTPSRSRRFIMSKSRTISPTIAPILRGRK